MKSKLSAYLLQQQKDKREGERERKKRERERDTNGISQSWKDCDKDMAPSGLRKGSSRDPLQSPCCRDPTAVQSRILSEGPACIDLLALHCRKACAAYRAGQSPGCRFAAHLSQNRGEVKDGKKRVKGQEWKLPKSLNR